MIYVIDEIMGRGKTSAILNMINNSSDKKKFMFVTPYLSECDRVVKECKSKRFITPKGNPSKISELYHLLKSGENVVVTHSLFGMLYGGIFDLIKAQGYTLILDEVMDVVKQLKFDYFDEKVLKGAFIEQDPSSHQITWVAGKEDYNGRFKDIRLACQHDCMFNMGNPDKKGIYIATFPINVFDSFQDVYIMTYMFKGQIQSWYYDAHGLEYKRLYVHGSPQNGLNNLYLSESRPKNMINFHYKDLVHIVDEERLNRIGFTKKRKIIVPGSTPLRDSTLSKTWFQRDLETGGKGVHKLKNNCNTIFRKRWGDNSKLNMWTSFKTYQNHLKGPGYTKGFVPLNMRATNEFADRTRLAYLCNRYLSVGVKAFFAMYEADVRENEYALSEMLQWIWRSAIRNGQPINIYVPSARMRWLLSDWLENPDKYSEWDKGGEVDTGERLRSMPVA